MEHLSISIIKHFVEEHALIAYLIIILGIVIEGEVVVIFAGIFSHLGSLNIFVSYLAVLLGGSIKSILGYTIGWHLQNNHAQKPSMKKTERRIAYFLPSFEERPFFSIFISRFFILGIGWFTVLFSGYKKIPLRIYAKAEGLSLAIWSFTILGLGWFFSFAALSISRDIRKFLLVILLFFILFFVLEKILAFVVELFNIQQLDKIEE